MKKEIKNTIPVLKNTSIVAAVDSLFSSGCMPPNGNVFISLLL